MVSLLDPLLAKLKGNADAHSGLLQLACCPFCGGEDRDVVCRFNRFVLKEEHADETASRYDYCLCNGCGVVYASRRPVGDRFRNLSGSFNETLGRQPRRQGGKILLNPHPLTDDDRETIRRLSKTGALVSEHRGLGRNEWLAGVLRDKLANAAHIDLIGSLIRLDKPRVLEIRSRTGSNLECLRRLYGAEVFALPMFESQKEVIERFFDIPADGLIDFEDFAIPYDGPFDLILCNHMLTHAIRPERFLEAVATALKPGGHVYFYNEPDDRDFCVNLKTIYSVLNPFHLQTFDGPSLVRALAARRFETLFLTHVNDEFACLVRFAPGLDFQKIPPGDLQERQEGYRKARDLGFVKIPKTARARIGQDWQETCKRLEADGLVSRDDRGKLRDVAGRLIRKQ